MQPATSFGYEQIVKELIQDVLDTVADKPGQTPERKASARQTVVCSVMAYNPRDPVEAMMAGQCVVYDHLLRHGARDMLRGLDDQLKIRARPGILATGKMFLATVEMLIRMQARAEGKLAFARQLPAQKDAPNTAAADHAVQRPPVAAPAGGPVRDARTPDPSIAPHDAPQAARPTPTVSPVSVIQVPTRETGPVSTDNRQPAPGQVARGQPARGQAASVLRVAAPVPLPGTNVPPGRVLPALLSYERAEEIRLDRKDPALRREIRAAVSRATDGR